MFGGEFLDEGTGYKSHMMDGDNETLWKSEEHKNDMTRSDYPTKGLLLTFPMVVKLTSMKIVTKSVFVNVDFLL